MKLEQPSYDALIRAQWKYRAERLRHRRAGRHPIVAYQRYVATGYEYFWDQQIPEINTVSSRGNAPTFLLRLHPSSRGTSPEDPRRLSATFHSTACVTHLRGCCGIGR